MSDTTSTEEDLAPKPPKDNYKFVYLTFLCLGMAILLPWNSLIMALDYFEANLPGHDINFVVSILSNGPLFITNLLMIILAPYFPDKITTIVTMLMLCGLTIALPLFPELIDSLETLWVIIFIAIIVISCVNGVMQCCAFGYTASIPGNYIGPLNTGCAVSGLAVSIARAFSLLIFPTKDDPNDPNYFRGALVYFILGVLTLVLGIFMLLYLPYTRYFKSNYFEFHTKRRHSSYDTLEVLDPKNNGTIGVTEENNNLLEIEEENKSNPNKMESLSYMFKIHNTLLITGYGLVIIYIQTFCVFPAVLLEGNIDFISSKAWEVWFIISLYNFADTVSRFVSEYKVVLTVNTSALATLLRCIPIGFAFLSAYDIVFFRHDAFKIINILIIGFTNGYIGNCQMMLSVDKAKAQDKVITSKFMALFLVLGITLGSIVSSFGITKLFDSE